MTGTDKRKPLLIGNAQNPRCLKHVDQRHLPITYCSNRKAWMDTVLWKQWLGKFDTQMWKSGRKILLIVDNVSTHKAHMDLRAIELVYLPPNTTSHVQPLDQGIIRAFKSAYRTKLLRRLLLWLETGKDVNCFRVNLLDCIQLSNQAWKEVDMVTIVNCFRHAGFHQGDHLLELVDREENENVDKEARNIFEVLFQQFGNVSHMNGISLDDYLDVDNDLITEQPWQDEDIISQVLCVAVCSVNLLMNSRS
jgi:hypothetical protein